MNEVEKMRHVFPLVSYNENLKKRMGKGVILMMNKLILRQLSSDEEANLLCEEYIRRFPWYHSDYFTTCLLENREGKRVSLMAMYEGKLAGCCHLLYESAYPHFKDANIPEINDLSVFPAFRRNKIASTLLDELERMASERSRWVGLGVGLYQDYGNAQMMYNKRGYVMDGKGITYQNIQVNPGQSVIVDDDLLIYLVKDLSK